MIGFLCPILERRLNRERRRVTYSVTQILGIANTRKDEGKFSLVKHISLFLYCIFKLFYVPAFSIILPGYSLLTQTHSSLQWTAYNQLFSS